jgi:hypothetical protein
LHEMPLICVIILRGKLWLVYIQITFVFEAISWREQVNFQWDDDEVHFVLDQHSELDFYSASSLKQQSADRHVASLGHIILISSQLALFFLLTITHSLMVCSEEPLP